MTESSAAVDLAQPLKGIRVLELAQFIAGPLVGQQLADFGAEVIKIERPGGGDPFREYETGGSVPNYGYNYRALNRNKRSVVVDLRNPDARQVILELSKTADVLLENFRPGVLDRLGIGYEALKAVNPRLIYCAVSGFYAGGSSRNRPAFDLIGQALSGMLYLFTDPDKPVLRGPTIADQATALQAANAVVAALYGRTRSNEGCRIDISMIDATASFIADVYAAHTGANIQMTSDSRAAVSHAFVMRCADDKFVAIQLGARPGSFESLSRAVDSPELLEHPSFQTRADRIANWGAVLDALRPQFGKYLRDVIVRRLIENDIACAEVLDVAEAVASEELRESGIFQHLDSSPAGPIVMMQRSATINGSRGDPQRAPALLGEDTDAVLRAVGYDEDRVAALRAAGIVGNGERA